MNVDAVTMFGAAAIRRRRGSLLGVALITALVVAAILAATAGARRTSSVLDRYLAATDASDVVMGLLWPTLNADGERVLELLDEVRASPGVEAVRADGFVPVEAGTENDFGLLVPYATRDSADRALVQDGRYPADDAPDEVAINESAASELGVGVGDTLTGMAMDRGAAVRAYEEQSENFVLDDEALSLRVVGVVRNVDDLSPTGSGNPVAYASPAFRTVYSDVAILGSLFRLDVDASAFDLPATRAVVEAAAPSRADSWAGWGRTDNAPIATAFDAIAVGLTIFAAIGLVAGVLVLALVMARQAQLGRDDRDAGRTLGMTHSELSFGCAGPLALALTPGVALGSLLAFAVSGLFPYSVARRPEVGGLLRFDPLVHIGLAAVIWLVLVTASGVISRRAALPAAPTDDVGSRFSSLWVRLSPPVADGCSAVVAPGGRRSSIRPWTAICGAAIGVAGIVAIGVFESSRTAATDDPARFGATWDLQPEPMFTTGDPEAAISALAEDPRTDGVGGVFCGMPTMAGQPTQLCTYEIMSGTIEPSVSEGRAPTSPDEIALGRETAARYGVTIGDEIEVADRDGVPVILNVVGIAVNPDVADSPRPGSGAIMTTEGLEQVLGSIWEQSSQTLIISFADGLDPATTATALARDHPIEVTAYSFAQPPDDLAQLGRMRTSLVALACFLGGLGVVGLLHYLVLSARRRRREVAVLRALGFVRRQVIASTATQAVTVSAIGVAIGLPTGVIVGRWTWLATVDDLGMIDTPDTPAVMLTLVGLVAVVGAAVIAAAPGWRAAQLRPATGLREE